MASQVILPGNVPVKVAEGADMAAGMIGMAVVAEGVMVLIGMEIGLGDGTGILVVMGEVNDTIVTVLAHMTGANDSFKLCDEELEDPRLPDANIGSFFSQDVHFLMFGLQNNVVDESFEKVDLGTNNLLFCVPKMFDILISWGLMLA